MVGWIQGDGRPVQGNQKKVTVVLERGKRDMSERSHMLPVWFFIGMLLTVYGAIILITSIVDYSKPATVVLANYHPGILGGILLLLIGGFYTFWFWPGRRGSK